MQSSGGITGLDTVTNMVANASQMVALATKTALTFAKLRLGLTQISVTSCKIAAEFFSQSRALYHGIPCAFHYVQKWAKLAPARPAPQGCLYYSVGCGEFENTISQELGLD